MDELHGAQTTPEWQMIILIDRSKCKILHQIIISMIEFCIPFSNVISETLYFWITLDNKHHANNLFNLNANVQKPVATKKGLSLKINDSSGIAGSDF